MKKADGSMRKVEGGYESSGWVTKKGRKKTRVWKKLDEGFREVEIQNVEAHKEGSALDQVEGGTTRKMSVVYGWQAPLRKQLPVPWHCEYPTICPAQQWMSLPCETNWSK